MSMGNLLGQHATRRTAEVSMTMSTPRTNTALQTALVQKTAVQDSENGVAENARPPLDLTTASRETHRQPKSAVQETENLQCRICALAASVAALVHGHVWPDFDKRPKRPTDRQTNRPTNGPIDEPMTRPPTDGPTEPTNRLTVFTEKIRTKVTKVHAKMAQNRTK